MSKRNYNVFFNTHTVSGILISAALYIIFFAGAFAFFKEEIKIWQEGKTISHTERKNIDYDAIFKELDKKYELSGRDLQLNFGGNTDEIFVYMSASKDSLSSEKGKKSHFFYKNFISKQEKNYKQNYNLGEFLFRLHFLDQIPYLIGRYLSGFIAFFFLFAIITGVIVHWKKVISNFYSFNPKAILKKVWTDAHTALGIIGFPFQFIFAVTGTYFVLGVLVLIPANFLYEGNQNKLMADLRPTRKNYEWIAKSNQNIPSFNTYVKKTANKWNDFKITRGFVKNYAGKNMKYIINGELKTEKRFIGFGSIIYDAFSGKIEAEKNPNELSYLQDSQFVFIRLHFANFGGIPLKILYFLMAIITCFVIITGVLIWVEARNKNSITLKQRLYTAKVGHIYLAICLSMLPVTALAFIFVKCTEGVFSNKQLAIYYFYFLVWGAFILFFRFKRNNYYTNKVTLLLGSIFGFLVPVANGLISKKWFWNTYANHQFEILLIDLLWITIASVSLLFYFKIKPSIKNQSSFAKNPIDYKNIKALKANEKHKLISSQQLSPKTEQLKVTNQNVFIKNKNYMPMRIKIVILWIFLGIGWIVHHIYGLFNVYYNETLVIEGATGEAPMLHHIYRIIFEGLCLLFGLLTIEIYKKWFIWVSFVWAIIAGAYNIYHVFEALLFEPTNISEIFMLLLVATASVFLVINLKKEIKNYE